WRAISEVAVAERAPQAEVRLALDPARRRFRPDLVREQVVVHRDDPEGVADEGDLEQRDVPDPLLAPLPVAEPADLARVVPEAARSEHRVERVQVALQARRSPADHIGRPEREQHRWA